MKYRVLSGASADSLEKQVDDLMGDGYEPLGGVSALKLIDGSILYSQAMINPEIQIIRKGER